MIRRLKVKFICINMLIVTVMILIIFGMILHITVSKMEEQSVRMIHSVFDDPHHRGPGLTDNRVPYFTAMVSRSGTYTIDASRFITRNTEQELQQIARRVYENGNSQGVLWDYSLRFIRRSVPIGDQIVFIDISVEQETMKELFGTCFSVSIVSFAAFFFISILLAQWAIRPVEEAWEAQKQFVGDASHELKTPLTVIMTNAELLQEPCLPETDRLRFSSSILTMTRQMRGLVEGLLELSRVDNGSLQTVFSEVCLSNLVEDSALPFDPLFFEKGMELEVSVEPGIRVHGSESHLRQVTEILLDNAVKYGENSQPARLTLVRQGRNALLSVSTAGETISQQDLTKIFRRFYRVDSARAMNQSYGMGLSIAKAIVESHRGRIWVESKKGINTFFVQIPVKNPSIPGKTG